MKRLVAIILLLFLGINIAEATNWKIIIDGVYYDTETVESANNGVRFWVKSNLENGYTKELIYLNFAEKTITTEQIYKYNKNDILIASEKISHKERIIPDTVSEAVYHYFSDSKNYSVTQNFLNATGYENNYKVYVGSYTSLEQANVAKGIVESTVSGLHASVKCLGTNNYTLLIGVFETKPSAAKFVNLLKQKHLPARIDTN